MHTVSTISSSTFWTPLGSSVILGTTRTRMATASTATTATMAQVTSTVALMVTPPREIRSAQISTVNSSAGTLPKISCSSFSARVQIPARNSTVGHRTFFRFLPALSSASPAVSTDLRQNQPPRVMPAPRAKST